MRNIRKQKRSRNTKQQNVILEALQNTDLHPTADELFIQVRKVLPRVSLATVYRNLAKMEVEGKLRVFEHAGDQRRYDGNTENHIHARCRSCGKLVDVRVAQSDMAFLDELAKRSVVAEVYIDSYNLELLGLCSECS